MPAASGGLLEVLRAQRGIRSQVAGAQGPNIMDLVRKRGPGTGGAAFGPAPPPPVVGKSKLRSMVEDQMMNNLKEMPRLLNQGPDAQGAPATAPATEPTATPISPAQAAKPVSSVIMPQSLSPAQTAVPAGAGTAPTVVGTPLTGAAAQPTGGVIGGVMGSGATPALQQGIATTSGYLMPAASAAPAAAAEGSGLMNAIAGGAEAVGAGLSAAGSAIASGASAAASGIGSGISALLAMI